MAVLYSFTPPDSLYFAKVRAVTQHRQPTAVVSILTASGSDKTLLG